MFTYRLRGLLNLHILATTLLVTGYFLLLALVTTQLPWLTLSPDVSLARCFLLVTAGMLLSGRFVTSISSRFHDMGWSDGAYLATRQIGMVTLVLFAAIVATKDRSISRLFLAVFLGTAWCLLVFMNRYLPRYLADLAFSRLHRLPTLFMGQGDELEHFSAWIARQRHLGIVPIGFLAPERTEERKGPIGRWLGTPTELDSVIEQSRVAQVILVNAPASPEETRKVVAICQSAGCRLLIYDNIAERLPVPMIPVLEDGHFFLTMQAEPLEDPMNRVVKRLYDIAVSLPVVLFLLPVLCAMTWIGQRLQAPGPLFFNRPRGGRMRSEFEMVKFRSMYHEQKPDPGREAVQATSGDPRVYPFGRFLRHTSLDEFPQFWNVLKGDMSIVGPRPHLPKHDYEFSQIANLYRTRQLVKPGITGLAQISGYRGEITDPTRLHGRVSLDIFYITHWSLWLDVQITLKTLWEVIAPGRAAY